ncbi:hypothetical protein E3P94_00828 [Wallemia ichthyophaga]|nr:hypothetical protein E3P95_00696 [Wallemia ichthyophaga]TIB03959.1 hypothetical protein E3P94_00828 [Wallemia ichthyophaga]
MSSEDIYPENVDMDRIYLSLKSGLLAETDWALSQLLVSSNQTHHFNVNHFHGLLDALFDFPIEASKCLSDNNLDYNHSSYQTLNHQANDALTIINNLSITHSNLPIIHSHHKTILALSQRYLRFLYSSDTANEITLKLLSILESIGDLLQEPPKNPLLGMIADLIHSHDRAYVLLSLRLIAVFVRNNPHLARVHHQSLRVFSPAIDSALLPDPHLRAAALEFIYASASTSPAILTHLLTHAHLPILVKSLAYMLYDETIEEERRCEFTDTTNAPPLVSLSDEECERIGMMTEPNRTREWIKAVWALNPTNLPSIPQSLLTLYRDTLSKYAYHTPLLGDEEVCARVQEHLHAHRDSQSQEKSQSPSPSPSYTCYWGDDRTTFATPDELYAYISRTYIDIPTPPVTFTWGGVLFAVDSTSSVPRGTQLKGRMLALVGGGGSARSRKQQKVTAADVHANARPPGVAYTLLHVPCDDDAFPRGIAYQAALLLRLLAQKANPLAKNVLQTDEANRPESKGYYGLPVPPSQAQVQEQQQQQQDSGDDVHSNALTHPHPRVTSLLSLFARRPLADVAMRNSSLLRDVCREAFEFIENDSIGSLVVESV